MIDVHTNFCEECGAVKIAVEHDEEVVWFEHDLVPAIHGSYATGGQYQ